MKFNAEQLTEYLNMEAAYKDMSKRAQELFDGGNLDDAEYEDLSRRYAYATIQMVKLRSHVRGPSYGQAREA